MGTSKQLLTSQEFADRSGLSVSKVTKLIRDGRIKGQKEGGKWLIPASELKAAQKPAAPPQKKQPRTKPAAASPPPAVGPDRSYSVAEFSAMTYLTEYGVREWLKKGMLQGAQSEDGEWRIDAASLENPHIKRLVR